MNSAEARKLAEASKNVMATFGFGSIGKKDVIALADTLLAALDRIEELEEDKRRSSH